MLKNLTSLSYRFWSSATFLVLATLLSINSAFAQQPMTGFPYTDSFKNTTSPGAVFGGTNGNGVDPYSAFLTASQTAVTAYGSVGAPSAPNSNQLVTADANGGGYLRLTRTVQNQTGFARNTRSFPSAQGLSISFEYYTYGFNADGIAFSLFDADVLNRSAASNTAVGYPATPGFNIGQFGGSLGYAQRDLSPGLSGAFLGIGIDEFGNFGTTLQSRQGGFGAASVSSTITLRGDGDGTGGLQRNPAGGNFGAGTNYEYLTSIQTTSAPAMIDKKNGAFNIQATAAPASRTAGFATTDMGYRRARITVEFITTKQFKINVYIDENSGAGLKTHHVIEDYNYVPSTDAPARLSYAFSASTGGSTNVHEIRAIDIGVPGSVKKEPIATAASKTTLEDNSVTIDLRDYAYDENGNITLNLETGLDLDPTIAGIRSSRPVPLKGTFTSNGDGTVTFVPVLNYNGDVVTTYTVEDTDNTTPFVAKTTSNAASLTIRVTPVNDPPNAVSSSVTVNEGQAYTFKVTDFQFTDSYDNPTPNGLSAIIVGPISPASGTLTFGGNPVSVSTTISAASITSLIYTPAPHSSASPTTIFNFKVQDNGGTANGGIDLSIAAATMTINVLPVNDPPSGTDKLIATNEDTAYTFVTADFGFTDAFDNPPNNFLSVLVSPVGAGTLTIGGVPVAASTTISAASVTAGLLIYTPPLNANGNPLTTFTFQVKDNGGVLNGGVDTDQSPNTISFNVIAVNDAPVANPDVNTVTEDVTLTVASGAGLLSNDTDVEGTALTITQYLVAGDGVAKTVGTPVVITGVGTINISANGSYSFIPVANYTGAIPVITYSASDGALSATSTLTLTITPVNDAPSFVKGANQTIQTTSGAQTMNGWATALSKGPADEAAQTLTFTVTNNNNTLFTVQPTISSTGVLSYTPAGTAGTATVTVTLKDDGGVLNGGVDTYTTQTFTITVSATPAGNTPPVVDVISKVGVKDTPVSFTPTDFTNKYTDTTPLSKIKIVSLPPSGTLKLNGVDITANQEIPAADLSKITYVPVAGFTGGPVSFLWNGSDGTDYAVTPKNVNITINATNSAPVAVADSYSTVKGGTLTVPVPGVLNNDTDPDGNTISAIKVSDPTNGTLTFNSNGSFTYVHNNGVSTSDSFTYKVNDGAVDGNTVTVTIGINASNTPPLIADIPKIGTLNQPVPFTITDFSNKFTDPNGDALNKIKIITLPTSGVLKFNGVDIVVGQEIPNADLAKITFIPPAGFVGGPISFQWNGSDGTDYAVVPKNVNISISATNIPPVAVADSYTTTKGGTLTISAPGVLSNDSDVEGNIITAIKVTNPTNGTVTLNSDGSFTYIHTNTSTSSDSFTYRVNDGTSDGNTVTVSINLINAPPVVSNLTKTGTGFGPIPFTVNDFTNKYIDPDGDPLVMVRIISIPPNGVLKLNGVPVTANQEIPVAELSKLTFEPGLNWSGTTNFIWNGSDGTTYATNNANAAITVVLSSDPNAKLGLAKNLASVTSALNGTYDVKFVFTAVNYGINALENITIRDNLALAFGGAEVIIKSVTAFGNLKANTSYNGNTSLDLLLGSSSLSAGEEAKVELLINVKLGLTGGTYQNSATAEGISSITGLKVTDVSTNGLKPDPINAGDISPSVSTPIQLDVPPAFVPAGFSPNGDGMNDKFVIQNALGKQVSLEVFNRWGNRVYKSVDYKNDWGGEVTEGFFIGRDIPDGTYYYIIIIDNKDKYAGFITVNR